MRGWPACCWLQRLTPVCGAVVQTVKDVVQSLVDDSIVDFEKIGSQNFYWAFPSKATIKVWRGGGACRCAGRGADAQHYAQRKNQIDALTADLEKLEARKQELQAELATLMDGREGSVRPRHHASRTPLAHVLMRVRGQDERLEMKERLGALQARHDELERELAVLRENDPEVLRELGERGAAACLALLASGHSRRCCAEGGVKTAKDATNRWTDNLWSVKSYVVKKLGRSSREVDQMLRLPADFDYVE